MINKEKPYKKERDSNKCKNCYRVKMSLKLIEELNAIVYHSYDGIAISNKDGVLERVNKAYERITGVNRQKILEKTGAEMIKEGIIVESVTAQVIETKKPWAIEQIYPNGKRAVIIANPIFDENGNIEKIMHNVRDITEIDNLKRKFIDSLELTKYY